MCDLSVEGDSVTSVGWSERVSEALVLNRRAPLCRFSDGVVCFRGIWWRWALIKAWCRSGTRRRGRSCPCWRVTRLAWVSARRARGRFCSSASADVCVRVLSRVSGALAWNVDQLSSGSRDRLILQRDIRAPPLQSERRLQGHRQEVCGLKWSTDHQLLASGGNDNKVRRRGPKRFVILTEHTRNACDDITLVALTQMCSDVS